MAVSDATSRFRVVHVFSRMDTGGVETNLLEVLPRLDRARFEPVLVCLRRRGTLAAEFEQRGVPLHVVRGRGPVPSVLSTIRLSRWMRRHRPHIVHGHIMEPVLHATRAALRADVPVIVGQFHSAGETLTRAQIALERRLGPCRQATLFVSEAVRRSYTERIGPLASGAIAHNGIDVDHFAAPPSAGRIARLRSELALHDRGPVLLTVGRLHRHKRHSDLLKALPRLLLEHPRTVLLIAGDGPERENIATLASELDIAGAVRLLGRRSDVRDLYHLAHLHVLASSREGFPLVVLEAMAAGLPQVLTDVGGTREAIGDSGAALLVPPEQPHELAAAMLAALAAPGGGGRERPARAPRCSRFADRSRISSGRTPRCSIDGEWCLQPPVPRYDNSGGGNRGAPYRRRFRRCLCRTCLGRRPGRGARLELPLDEGRSGPFPQRLRSRGQLGQPAAG